MRLDAKMNKKTKGFTLIELLIVIAIIGIISTISVVALNNARAKARDAKRVADLKQISNALELYYSDNNRYPTIITPGQSLNAADGTTYLQKIPNNPSPRNDGNCPNSDYGYIYIATANGYYLYGCTGSAVGNLSAGSVTSKSGGDVTNEPFSGLVGWWTFEEGNGSTVYDYSGNNFNGTWVGTGTHYGSGKVGNYAGRFNGTASGDGVNVAVTTNGPIDPQYITETAWVKFNSMPYSSQMVTNKEGKFRLMAFDVNSSKVAIRYGTSQKAWASGTAYGITDLAANTWYHVAATYDGSAWKLYLNGNLEKTTAESGTLPSTSGYLYIGNSYGVYNLNGYIDDLRMYNRALSGNEIQALYNATK